MQTRSNLLVQLIAVILALILIDGATFRHHVRFSSQLFCFSPVVHTSRMLVYLVALAI